MCDSTIERILHDLKVIAAIRENDKLYTDAGLLNLDHGGVYSPIYRFVNGENRNKGLTAVGNIFQDAFVVAENSARRIDQVNNKDADREATIIKLKTFHTILIVRRAISRAISGIKNLRATYGSDTSVVARIDVLQERAVNGLAALDRLVDMISEKHDLSDGGVVYGEHDDADNSYMRGSVNGEPYQLADGPQWTDC